MLLGNARHRAFYFAASPSAGALAGSPSASSLHSSAMVAPHAESGQAAIPGGKRAPAPDVGGRVRIPVSDRLPSRLPADGVPAGWELKRFMGDASVEVLRDAGRMALRLRSNRASFALYRDVMVDLKDFPLLTWSWKVVRLPEAGDVRVPDRDDQAAQIYVIFPRWPSPRAASDVIGYVWDSRAPVGTVLTSARAANVRLIVVESGGAQRDTWLTQRRNVAADYVALFGRQPPRVGTVAVMIDSNDTGTEAEALVGDLVFSRSESTEIPTAMLR